MRISDWSSDVCSSDLKLLQRKPSQPWCHDRNTERAAHEPVSGETLQRRPIALSYFNRMSPAKWKDRLTTRPTLCDPSLVFGVWNSWLPGREKAPIGPHGDRKSTRLNSSH